VDALVDAVERSNYARDAGSTADLSRALARVSGDLRGTVDARSRVMAFLLPRSLFASDTSRIPAAR